MARLQVLPLPGTPEDPAPFLLVMDEVNVLDVDFTHERHAEMMRSLKDASGARHFIVTTGTVDVVR